MSERKDHETESATSSHPAEDAKYETGKGCLLLGALAAGCAVVLVGLIILFGHGG